MDERWYKRAVIYSVEVDAFQDSDGDGVGDLRGLISRLDYIARLGATCLWLNPVHPSPLRDEGYDITDYYGVHPQLGTLGDFVDLVDAAGDRGMRVLLDLVVNHTSIDHPWFQSARRSADSPYRDWYVWSDREPTAEHDGVVFPGAQTSTWTLDELAGAWYFHRFYDFEPELNHRNPAVRDEIRKIIAFWLRLGVAGFRMDAAPFVIETPHPDSSASDRDYGLLDEVRGWLSWRRGDAAVIAEANVPDHELPMFAGRSPGEGDRMHLLFNFRLNARLLLALSRRSAPPVEWALRTSPQLPDTAQWVTFIRNHDEADLSQLSDAEREEVFASFAPDESMRIYGRGIRRRLAPMLDGDRRRIELAYSLQFTLPGTPVVRYGEEIGMGDNLDLPERNSIRTPMQWSDGPTAGFSTADPARLVRPLVREERFDCRHVNVARQRSERNSLLAWFEVLLRTLRECPEIGQNSCDVLDSGHEAVLAHRFSGEGGEMLFLHNLGEQPCTVRLGGQLERIETPHEVFGDRDYGPLDEGLEELRVDGLGYRWIRVRFTP